MENIVVSCLESKKTALVEHLLSDCNLVGKLVAAEKQFILATEPGKVIIFTSIAKTLLCISSLAFKYNVSV